MSMAGLRVMRDTEKYEWFEVEPDTFVCGGDTWEETKDHFDEHPSTIALTLKELIDQYGPVLNVTYKYVAPRKPWVGDGESEPPSHVTKIRNKLGEVAEKNKHGWWWIVDGHGRTISRHGADGWNWYSGLRGFGPITEVLD
jgi:hypothetical protein